MVTIQTIEEVKRRPGDNVQTISNIYFWLRSPDDESDLDLLVVIEKYNNDSYQTLLEGHKALADLPLSKDLLVFSKEEFDDYSNDITRLCYKVKLKGKKIYAAAISNGY